VRRVANCNAKFFPSKTRLVLLFFAVSAFFCFQYSSYGASYSTLYSQDKLLRDKHVTNYSKFRAVIDGYDRIFRKAPNSYKGALAGIRMLDLYRYLARSNHSGFIQDRIRKAAYEIINSSKNDRARAYAYFAMYHFYKKHNLSIYVSWKEKLLKEYPDSWEAKLILKTDRHSINNKTITLPLVGKIIVVDPGHGGKDPGASGVFGIKEKNLVLKIAKILARRLQAEGATVLMTRNTDRFITLQKRAEFANRHHADAFISIHANASPNRMLSGIETFFLTTKADRKTVLIASRENGITPAQMNVLQKILVELVQNAKIDKSRVLAKNIQDDIVKRLGVKTKNLGVRQAPFYVLAGTKIPSVLIEVGFITNRKEAMRLESKNYRNRLIKGIVDGIENFFEKRQ